MTFSVGFYKLKCREKTLMVYSRVSFSAQRGRSSAASLPGSDEIPKFPPESPGESRSGGEGNAASSSGRVACVKRFECPAKKAGKQGGTAKRLIRPMHSILCMGIFVYRSLRAGKCLPVRAGAQTVSRKTGSVMWKSTDQARRGIKIKKENGGDPNE